MKDICALIICTFLGFNLPSNLLAQGTGYVTLIGKQFYDPYGDPFFPIVCNYKCWLFYNVGGIPDPIISREHHYGPSGLCDCSDQAGCFSEMLSDFQMIKSIGFNSLRILVPGGEYNPSTDRIEINVQHHPYWNPITYIYINPPYDYASNQTSYDILFSFYDGMNQAAETVGLFVIWCNSDRGFETNPAHNSAHAKVSQVIANHCKHYVNTLAWDMCNEPHLILNPPLNTVWDTKQMFCEYSENYYNSIKYPILGDPNHLVTVGAHGPENTYYFDQNFLKADFLSIHSYIPPSFATGRSYTLAERMDWVMSSLYWLSQVCNKPYIIGETGFRADLEMTPGGVDGTVADQYDFAEQTVEECANCGYSGYSWWDFQDSYNQFSPPPNNDPRQSFGLLYSDVPYTKKPVCDYFEDLFTNGIGSISGTCTKPTNYDSDIGLLLVPTGSNTLRGIVRVNGTTTANAIVLSVNNRYYGPTQDVDLERVYNTTFTNQNGEFCLTSIPSKPGPFPAAEPIHTIKLTAAGAGRKQQGAWEGNALVNNDIYDLSSPEFTYTKTINGVTLTNGDDDLLEAWNDLIVSNTSVGPLAIAELTARTTISAESEFHAQSGSEVHIFTSETFTDCEDVPALRIRNIESNHYNKDEILAENKSILVNFSSRNQFILYPNPSEDNCYLKYSGSNFNPFDILITDLTGRTIEHLELTNPIQKIDLSQWASGLYLIRISNNYHKEVIYLIHN